MANLTNVAVEVRCLPGYHDIHESTEACVLPASDEAKGFYGATRYDVYSCESDKPVALCCGVKSDRDRMGGRDSDGDPIYKTSFDCWRWDKPGLRWLAAHPEGPKPNGKPPNW